MSERIAFSTVAPELAKTLFAAHTTLIRASLDKKLIDLVFLRVSQINGCAYCIDLHAHDLRKAGETERRINALPIWREVELFDASECAALAWAESVTSISTMHASDEVYQPLLDYFSEQQIAELTFAVALMNLFNRLGVGLRKPLPNPNARAWPEEQAFVV